MKLLLSSLAITVATVFASLEAHLSHLNDTTIRASITNVDTKGYNFFSHGNILDSTPVRKLEVTDGCE